MWSFGFRLSKIQFNIQHASEYRFSQISYLWNLWKIKLQLCVEAPQELAKHALFNWQRMAIKLFWLEGIRKN